jgi:hypothetical protein
MLPMVLHSVFDFALHMPANAMWFSTLAGVMFHRGVEGGAAEGEATLAPLAGRGQGDGRDAVAQRPSDG